MKNFKTILIIAMAVMQYVNVFAQYNYFAGFSAGNGNTGTGVTCVGAYSLYYSNYGNNNSGFGYLSLHDNASGNSNTGIGSQSLYYNNNGNRNTATGYYSLRMNINGYNNSAFGAYALLLNQTGYENCAFGDSSLYNNLRSGNSAFGASSLNRNTAGGDNNAFGYHSIYSNDSGSANCAFGSYTLYLNSKGNQNSAFGTSALYNNTTGYANSAFGVESLKSNTTGYQNIAIGDFANNANTTGFNNTSVGSNALHLNNTGSNNTAIGRTAGAAKALYNKCTFLGATADVSSNNLTNATAIGYGAKVNASNKVQVGSTAVTSIGGQVGWTTFSDIRLKTNINNSKLGLDFILNLRPVTYNYKDEAQKDILYTGLIAQEVDAAAKKEGVDFSGVDKNGEYWGIRYGDLSVPLIKGMQEQQSIMESQQYEIKELKNNIAAIESLLASDQLQKVSNNVTFENKLEQNNPNPFSEKTIIKYSVSNDAISALIIIRSLNGVDLKRITLQKNNKGSITIEDGQLAQGTYTYTLEVNGKSVDTKLMVITK